MFDPLAALSEYDERDTLPLIRERGKTHRSAQVSIRKYTRVLLSVTKSRLDFGLVSSLAASNDCPFRFPGYNYRGSDTFWRGFRNSHGTNNILDLMNADVIASEVAGANKIARG